MPGLSSSRRVAVHRAAEQPPALKSTAASSGRTPTPTASPCLTPTSTVWARTPRQVSSANSPRLSRITHGVQTSPRTSPPRESHRGAEQQVSARGSRGNGRKLSNTSSSNGSAPAAASNSSRNARPETTETGAGASSMILTTRPPPRTRSLDPNLRSSLMASGTPVNASGASDALRVPRRRPRTPRPASARAQLSASRPGSGDARDAAHGTPAAQRSPTQNPSGGSGNTALTAGTTAAPEAKDAAAPAALSRPWLDAPPARGILKHRVAVVTSARTSLVASTPLASTPTALARPDLAGRGAGPAGARPAEASVSVPAARPERHVTFDEAAIEYLNASGSHVVYDDSRLGMQLDAVEWGTVRLKPMPSPEARGSASLLNLRRRTPVGTTASMAKASPDCWGADSEWFNAEFGAQLTPSPSRSSSLVDASGPGPDTVSSASASSSGAVVAHAPPRASLAPSPASNGTRRGCSHRIAGGLARRKKDGGSARAAGEGPAGDREIPSSAEPPTRSHTPTSSHVSRAVPAGPVSRARVPPPTATLSTTAAPATTATEASPSEDGNGSSPVLAYDDASFRTATPHADGHNGVRRSPSVTTPPPPLRVGDLRRPSPPASSVAFPSAAGGPGGGRSMRRDSGGPQPRLASPTVSLTSLEPALAAEVCGTGDGAARPAVPSSTPAAPEAVLHGEWSDSPHTELGAATLSTPERRLLHAVMQVHARSRRGGASPPSSHTSTAASSPTVMAASAPSSSGTGLLQSTTRTLGDPCANVLSAGIRQFLNGGALTPSSAHPRRLPRNSCSSGSESGEGQQPAHAPFTSPLHSGADDLVGGAKAPTSSAPPPSSVHRHTVGPSGGALGESSATGAPFLPSAPATVLLVPTPSSSVQDHGAETTAAPSAASITVSSTRRSSTANVHPHSLRLRGSLGSSSRCSAVDYDVDDESEPHIRVPVPTPRAPASSASSPSSAAVAAAYRRRSDDVR